MIGMSAPITQIIWNRVSNLAKERPRLASGASRCTIESKACLAEQLVTPSIIDNSAAPPSPPMNAVTKPATLVTIRLPTKIRSSVITRRSLGTINDPTKKPNCAVAATRPNCHSGAPAFLNSKANMNDRNPTMPRIRLIATDACIMPALRSSSRSASPAGSAATVVGGS